jgi:hypothetical protein
LDDSDKRLKGFAAKDVIEYFIRPKELEDLEKQIAAIEERLKAQK